MLIYRFYFNKFFFSGVCLYGLAELLVPCFTNEDNEDNEEDECDEEEDECDEEEYYHPKKRRVGCKRIKFV